VLQVIDTPPLWRKLQHDAYAERSPIVAESDIEPLMAKARMVVLAPTYLCA
jgi:hypothetical protein